MGGVRQTSFGGGELAPLLRGRSDLAVFGRGLRTMRNFFPTKAHGAAVSRPGSTYLGTTRDPTDDGVRLVPFVYSDDTSFALEVGKTNPGGNLYFRFWTDGGPLFSNAAQFGGGAYELLAGVTSADLRLLKWAQTGDILTLTHPDWPAQELRRLPDWDTAQLNALFTKAKKAGEAAAKAVADGNASVQADGYAPQSTRALAASSTVDNAIWILAWYPAFAAAARAAYVAAFRQVWTNDGGVPYAENLANLQGVAAVGGVAATSSVNAFNTAYANAYSTTYSGLLINSPHWTLTPVVFSMSAPFFGGTAGNYPVLLSPLPTVDASHPAKEWVYLCTLTVQDTATGRFYETSTFRISESWDDDVTHSPVALADNKLALYPYLLTVAAGAVVTDAARGVTIRRGAHPSLAGVNLADVGYRELLMNVYRGRKGLFGLVGTTDTDTFVDDGSEPNWACPPPLGRNPFETVDAFGASTIEHPLAVAFFQDRRVFLTTPKRPATVFASATGDYTNFDRHEVVPVAGEALEFDLASRRYEKGVHLVGHEQLVIGTRSSVWRMAGAGGPLDFNSVDAKVVDEVGMTDLQPLIIEGHVLFGRAKGSGVRALVFEPNAGSYSGRDLSAQSDHLFVGDSVGLQGTHTNRELVDWTYAEDPWGLVWAARADGVLLSLTYDGREYGWAHHDAGAPTSMQSAAAIAAAGDAAAAALAAYAVAVAGGDPAAIAAAAVVSASASADAVAATASTPATYRRVCSVPEGDEDAVYMLVTRSIAGAYRKTCVERMTSRVRRGSVEDDACVDCGLRYEGAPVQTITGLNHLYGELVWVVGVGNAPQGPLLVDRRNTGTLLAPVWEYYVTLPELPVANVGGTAGLYGPHTDGTVVLFVGLRYFADLETLDHVSAESRLKKKTVKRVGFEVDQTVGILGGQDFEHLNETRPNTVEDGYSAPVPNTQLVIVTAERKWDLSARAVLRQELPLPVTVVAVFRELELGE